MGQCKDCKSWKAQNEWVFVGRCHRWAVTKYDANFPLQILAPPDSCGYPMGELIRTLADFGCIHFEERKSQGPFSLLTYASAPKQALERAIFFKPTGEDFSLGMTKEVDDDWAQSLIGFLNNLWHERTDDGTV